MRADHARAAGPGDRAAPADQHRRYPPRRPARDGALSGRLLHLPDNGDPPRLRAARSGGGELGAAGLPPGALEGRAAHPPRRPVPAGPARRLDLPGPARRPAPAGMTDARLRVARVGPAAYDTVVIGAGLAGLTAALRLAEAGQP